jgi:hypothetical protein
MSEDISSLQGRPWFKRPVTIIWLILTLASFGLFAPSFIAYKRQLKVARLLAVFIVIGFLTSASVDNTYLLLGIWVVGLSLSLLLKEKARPKAPRQEIADSEVAPPVTEVVVAEVAPPVTEVVVAEVAPPVTEVVVAQTQKPIPEVAPIHIDDEDFEAVEEVSPAKKLTFGQWIHYVSKVAPQVKMVASSLKNEIEYQQNLVLTRDRFEQETKSINFDALDSDAERVIFETSGCGLIEVRKGARVTHRESTYSGSSSGGSVRIGRVSVGGSSSGGSSSSTSISYPAPDELTLIDDGGRFILTNLKVSYAGGMFTKTTDFKKIVDFQYKGRQLLIAPRTGSKVWITEFARLEELWIVAALIGVAHEIDEKRLDAKATTEYGDAQTAVQFAFKRKLMEVQLAYDDSVEEIRLFRQTYAQYQELFPTKVKDLGF